jgi:hypothetical protein
MASDWSWSTSFVASLYLCLLELIWLVAGAGLCTSFVASLYLCLLELIWLVTVAGPLALLLVYTCVCWS